MGHPLQLGPLLGIPGTLIAADDALGDNLVEEVRVVALQVLILEQGENELQVLQAVREQHCLLEHLQVRRGPVPGLTRRQLRDPRRDVEGCQGRQLLPELPHEAAIPRVLTGTLQLQQVVVADL